jgi:glycosyltransferase involved in cell wall biosynthesis
MARAARDAGYEVHVVTKVSDRAEAIRGLGFHVYPLDLQRGSVSPLTTAGTVIKVRRLIEEINPVILHNVALKPSVIGSVAAMGNSKVVIVNSINGLGSAFMTSGMGGKLLQGSLKTTLRLLLNRKNTRTILQNPEDFDAIKGIGVAQSQLVLVPGSGVDTDVLVPLAEPPAPPVRVAFVGRMIDDKGVRVLIKAHRLLRARGENIDLLLAGEPDLENPTSILGSELEAWDKEPGIHWMGHVEHIRDVWEQAHIAVLPSRGEGLPKSLLEAAACGRPSIATDVPGCRQIVIPGETGLLVKVNDEISLANAISELAHDAAGRRRMGAAARLLTEQRFSAADIGRQTVAIYHQLLAARADLATAVNPAP